MQPMTKPEAKVAYEQTMKEYCTLVDQLAAGKERDNLTMDMKCDMSVARINKLDAAEALRKDYHLDITDEDARREARKMEDVFNSTEQRYSELVMILDPAQKADLNEKRAAAKKGIDDYKSYHGV